jgi:hypothetical protein
MPLIVTWAAMRRFPPTKESNAARALSDAGLDHISGFER